MGVLDKYVQGSARPASKSGGVSNVKTGGGGVLSKYLGGGTSSGGSSDWYDPENYGKRMDYWSSQYQKQKPYYDESGQPKDTVKAKYYKEKLASDLLGSKEGLEDIAKQEGLELPEKKEKKSFLKRLTSFLNAAETGDVAYKQIKAMKEGEDYSNIKALKQYAKGVGKGIKGDQKDKKTYKDVLELLGMDRTKLSEKLPSLFSKSGKGIFKLKKGGIADVSDTGALGTVMDIALDPTTYLTGGVGAGRTIATKGGKEVLSKSGEKFLKKAAKQFGGKKGTKEGLKQAERMLGTAISRNPKKYAKYIKKGGLKFAGVPIVPEKYMKKLGDVTGATKVKEAARQTKPVQAAAGLFKRETRGGLSKADFRDFKDILQKKYYDKKTFNEGQIINILNKLSKKGKIKRYNKDEIKQITRALLERDQITKRGTVVKKGMPALSGALKKPGDEIAKILGSIAKTGKRANVLDKTRASYVPQLYKKPEKASGVLESYAKSGKPSTTTRFAKERKIDNIGDIPQMVMDDPDITRKEGLDIIFGKQGRTKAGTDYDAIRKKIKDVGLEPETDIFKLLGARMKASSDALANKELYQDLAKRFGKSKKDIKLGEKYVNVQSKHLGKDVMLPKDVANKLNKLEKSGASDSAVETTLRGWNKIQRFYKKNLTSLFPSFHARNAFSNVAQNFLDVGLDAANPRRSAQALRALKGGKGKINTKFGKYSYDDLKDLMKKHDITGSGRLEGEYRELDKTIGGKMATRLSPYKIGRFAGDKIENQARAVNFISNLKKGLSPEDAAKRTKKFLFDYDNLSNFEKKYLRSAIPFYCVPTTHEILTRQGWKKYNELKKGEQVLTSTIEGKLEWQPLQDVAVFDYAGILKKFERRGGKFLFTPDHRWLTETIKTKTKGKWYGGTKQIKRTYELNKSDIIPLTGEYDNKKDLLSLRLAAILGWVVTDGYFRWRGKNCEMVIYQSPKKHLKEVEKLTGNKRRKLHLQSGVCAVPVKLEDIKAINRVFKDKADLPSVVARMSSKELEVMRDAMMKAEGFITKRNRGGYIEKLSGFSQDPIKNKDVADAFQIILFLLGENGTISSKTIYPKTSKYLRVKEGMGKEYYNGKIWCPKTKNSTWIMRNGGAMIITGNTWGRKNVELQAKMLKEAPGKVAAETKMLRNVGEPISEEDRKGLPDFIQEQAGVKMGTDKYGRPVYYSGFGLPVEQFAKTMSDPGGELANMLSPLLKMPIEAKTGKSLFRDKDIKDIQKAEDVNFIIESLPNEKAKKKLKDFLDVKEVDKPIYVRGEKVGSRKSYKADSKKLWVLRNMPFARIINTIGYGGDESMEDVQKLQKWFTGIRGYSFDEEEQKYFKNLEAIEELQALLEKEGVMGKGATGQHYLKEREKYLAPYTQPKTKYGGYLTRNNYSSTGVLDKYIPK